MKRILINATQPEELRVAMVDGQRLYDLDIELPSRERKKANIYKARITRVEPSLEAVFVNFGADRHGFLPFKEIARSAVGAPEDTDKPIRDFLKEGQSVLVQVEKEERGTKGAALTTYISLAGRYLVLMPNNPRAGGVSRRIEGEDRAELREALADLKIPEGMGVIARTAGVGRTTEELQWDLDYMTSLWAAILEASSEAQGPALIHQESNVIIRALRDHMRNDVGEVVIDDETMYRQAMEFVERVMPNSLRKIRQYTDPVPLFNRFQIEGQIESAFERNVALPSGGALVIDHTEALISIDVNSARSTKGGDIEETAFHTNLEAADEVARQLRIRDLGGLIVIDFIDMGSNKHQREVENRLRKALEMDRARVQVGRISRFGLLEMSRQRLRSSLGESSHITCPRCQGHGQIRGVESLSLSILRLVEEEAMKDRTSVVLAQVPVDVGTFLLNEKRDSLADIEDRHDVDVSIVPSTQLLTPHYSVRRIRDDGREDELAGKNSYQLVEETDLAEELSEIERRPRPDRPLVQNVPVAAPPAPAPTPRPSSISAPAAAPATHPGAPAGLFARLIAALFPGVANLTRGQPTTEEPETDDRGQRAQEERRARGGRTRSDDDSSSGDRRRGARRPDRTRKEGAEPKASGEPKAQESATNADSSSGKGQSERRSGEKPGPAKESADATSGIPSEQAESSEDSRDDGTRTRSRRSRRGGRRRNRNRSVASEVDNGSSDSSGTGQTTARDKSSSAETAEPSGPTTATEPLAAGATSTEPADQADANKSETYTTAARPETDAGQSGATATATPEPDHAAAAPTRPEDPSEKRQREARAALARMAASIPRETADREGTSTQPDSAPAAVVDEEPRAAKQDVVRAPDTESKASPEATPEVTPEVTPEATPETKPPRANLEATPAESKTATSSTEEVAQPQPSTPAAETVKQPELPEDRKLPVHVDDSTPKAAPEKVSASQEKKPAADAEGAMPEPTPDETKHSAMEAENQAPASTPLADQSEEEEAPKPKAKRPRRPRKSRAAAKKPAAAGTDEASAPSADGDHPAAAAPDPNDEKTADSAESDPPARPRSTRRRRSSSAKSGARSPSEPVAETSSEK